MSDSDTERPQLLGFNKLDELEPARRPLQLKDSVTLDGRELTRIFVSARSGEGLPLLRAELEAAVQSQALEAGGDGVPAPIGHNDGLHSREVDA